MNSGRLFTNALPIIKENIMLQSFLTYLIKMIALNLSYRDSLMCFLLKKSKLGNGIKEAMIQKQESCLVMKVKEQQLN